MSSVKCFFAFSNVIGAHCRCAPHDHPCTEVVMNHGCRGRVYDDDQKADYADGTLFLYQPGHRHWVQNTEAGVQFCIGITGCHAEKLSFGVLPASAEIAEISCRLQEEAQTNRPYMGEYLDLLAGQLTLEILRQQQTPQTPEPVMPAEKARNIIDARFDEKLTIGELAEALFISPDYLRQLFRESFAESPMHYLIRRRIDHACHLLWESEESLAEIARKCGMENPYYFSRIFRKVTGFSPTAYREKFRRDHTGDDQQMRPS